MSRTSIKKFSVLAGLFAFTLLFFGSWINEARIVSAFIRGLEGFCVFGFVTWLVLKGWAVMTSEERLGGDNDKDKGINLDQTA
ncbi:MAG: hypothetical protein OEZ51_05655 [Nitrospinota bacterium]|nr:hypothetical protein [Nitrospinota bacterium]